jgi:hypothetical protein
MVIMFIDKNGNIYQGDMVLGDREATPDEIAAWEESRKPTYADLRRVEYPPIAELIDGLVKDDAAQIQAYKDACLMVKAKYPKP